MKLFITQGSIFPRFFFFFFVISRSFSLVIYFTYLSCINLFQFKYTEIIKIEKTRKIKNTKDNKVFFHSNNLNFFQQYVNMFKHNDLITVTKGVSKWFEQLKDIMVNFLFTLNNFTYHKI